MTLAPQLTTPCRPPRFRLPHSTHAVLRFQDGKRAQGELQVVSLTGGLLYLKKPLDRGSRVKLMFLTHSGPVLGAAEMLVPVSWDQQPFRFVALQEDDQRRLRSAIQSSVTPVIPEPEQRSVAGNGWLSSGEQQWIEKYRAAQMEEHPPRRFLRKFFAAVTLATLGVGSAIYFLGIHIR
jgi:hypothetical protein